MSCEFQKKMKKMKKIKKKFDFSKVKIGERAGQKRHNRNLPGRNPTSPRRSTIIIIPEMLLDPMYKKILILELEPTICIFY